MAIIFGYNPPESGLFSCLQPNYLSIRWFTSFPQLQEDTMPFSNPMDPFGAPNPMEDVLSLQTYSADAGYLLAATEPTVSCTAGCCPTNTCTVSCPPKDAELQS
jgi:hypothetical protein